MQVPISDYYTEKDPLDPLLYIRKMLERLRLRLEAEVAKGDKKEGLSQLNKDSKQEATTTKTTIEEVDKQMDTAISGQFRTKMKTSVKEKLQSYQKLE